MPAPDPTSACEQEGKLACRPEKTYRSYVMEDDVKLASEFVRLNRKKPGERYKRGSISSFLAKKNRPAGKVYYDHFRRVLGKIEKNSISAPAGRASVRHARKRRRFLGKQGLHLIKAPVLRQQLFEWFCNIRGKVKGRLPHAIVEQKALSLRLLCIREGLEQGAPYRVPKIAGTNWLWRWRKLYNISLRKPNKRWKVPRKVLLTRLRIMWLNIIRIRTLCILIFNHDPWVLMSNQFKFFFP